VSYPPASYIVQLLFESTPQIDFDRVLQQLKKTCGKVQTNKDNKDALTLTFKSHEVVAQGARIQPMALISMGNRTDIDQSVLEQNLEFPELAAKIQSATKTVIIGDLLANYLPYKTRLSLIHNMVSSVLEQVTPTAILWTPSGYLLPPETYTKSKLPDGDVVYPAIKLRSFNISNAEKGSMIIDTLGLAPFGLPDVQCHFRDLDPPSIAESILALAQYIFDRGDVVADGNTVRGITDFDKWKCRHEESIADPKRLVIDVNPGPPYNCR
jgi:hypothetical protein